MNIFITGASGFVGSEILKLLLENNYSVTALTRNPAKINFKNNKLKIIKGDILNPSGFENDLERYDIIINLIGIIRENIKKGITFQKLHIQSTENVIQIAKMTSTKKIIQMSANGVRKNAISNYHKTKFKAEESIKKSGLDYIIFRPSVIYGPNDDFINMLANFMKKTLIFSYFGTGDYPMQPVSVFEVAEIFQKSCENTEIINKEFSICGNKILTYKELLQLIMKIKNWNKILISVPESIIKLNITLFGNFSWFPLTKDQFQMLIEGNSCTNREIFEILNIKSLDIEKVLKTYL